MANQPKKYKKFVATAATATLVASAIVPVASAAGFKDVANSDHATAINALADKGVINGYPDGTFKPNKELTRSDVVKLLGKYLVSEGYEVPADYSTVQRFNDVPVDYKDQELVKYAALVKETGVFKGSNNNLNAANKITRGQMALVVVRALDTLNDTDLVSFVEGQDFDKEVIDLNSASKEQQAAINVLDYFEITKSAKFNPNNTTTRGQFASFLYRAINTNFSDVTDVAVKSVVALNNTTVAVTFNEKVENLSSLDFSIEGLEVKNAALSQSDSSVVILTTAAQEAGKEYTVKLGDSKIGKFKGISAVVPTAVKVVEFTNPVVEGKDTTQVNSHNSQQAPLGTQVTLRAQVTVAEGQSKAGIPVTFNIIDVSNKEGAYASLNQPIIYEAVTNEDGVATYTYTRYASTQYQLVTQDEVQVYATGNPTARDFSKVYWANIQPLTISEVTQGNDLNNGAKKVYKVKLANGAGKTLNVGFLDNVNVDPNKANKNVTITDDTGRDLGYPGQYTTSTAGELNTKRVFITLDSKGEATFTLTGSNETVTPFVWVDQTAINNTDPTIGRFDKTELVAFAAPVTFAKKQNLGLTNDAQGVQKSAAYSSRSNVVLTNYNTLYANRDVLSTKEFEAALKNVGGRNYTAVLTDDKGAKAPAGTVVKVKVDIGTALSKNDNDAVVYLADNNAKRVYKVSDKETINLYTDGNGQVSYRLFGAKDSYATPTVFVESGDKVDLDDNDLQKAGEMVHFSDAVINTAKLTVVDSETAAAVVADSATVKYQTVDQNGFQYFDGNEFVTTFQLTTTFSSATVKYTDSTGNKVVTVNPGSSYSNTIAVPSVDGVSTITVEAIRGTRVDIVASASRATLPILTGTATFSKVTNEGIGAGQSVTGKVVAIDTVANRILLTNAAGTKTYELNYKNANLLTRNSPNSIDTFEKYLTVGDELKFTQATDNTVAQFHNYDYDASAIKVDDKSVTVVIADDLAKYDDVTEEATKGYDFNNITIGAASKPAKFEILGNNVILKNVTINGDIYVDEKVANDFTLDNVTVNGNVYINGGDGNTQVFKNSTINGKVYVNIGEHVELTNTTIDELVVKANYVSVTGTGTINKVTVANGVNILPNIDKTIADLTDTTEEAKAAAKAALTTAVAKAKAVDTTGKTEASKKALTDAITAAEAVLAKADATTLEYTNAKTSVEAAVAGLKDETTTNPAVVITNAESKANNPLLPFLLDYTITGTVAEGTTLDKLELTLVNTDGTEVAYTATNVTVTGTTFTVTFGDLQLPDSVDEVKAVKLAGQAAVNVIKK
ncbi:S-layer family protein [Ureibacillus xyleni]|uniref:S-layer family protein n=1 Tax=Ureibacillus xyleni TaxID=614648 RepID=A0A285R834_9BACL|nr:S-layer homology domain-containing protein [Ureibacillus xyleni]SOB90260.1 S-layer family protein [Ureibacillus xyleni]